jgi:ABC-type dipeptide/oligopeptide/nickel transport system permease component
VVSALRHIVLPGAVLGIFISGYVARITRTTMIETFGQDYIRTALAKGSSIHHIVVKDSLPNTALPVLTVFGLLFGLLLSGAAVTETVFAYPGMGQLLVNAISGSDFPQIQASVLVLAVIYCVVNAIVDILYAVVDPRVRLT